LTIHREKSTSNAILFGTLTCFHFRWDKVKTNHFLWRSSYFIFCWK